MVKKTTEQSFPKSLCWFCFFESIQLVFPFPLLSSSAFRPSFLPSLMKHALKPQLPITPRQSTVKHR